MYMFTCTLSGIVRSQLMHKNGILVTTGTPITAGTPASDELSAGVYGGIAAGAAALLVLLVVLLFCACGMYVWLLHVHLCIASCLPVFHSKSCCV